MLFQINLKKIFQSIAAVSIVLIATLTSACAIERDAFVNRVQDIFKASHMTLKTDNIEQNDNSFIFYNAVAISSANNKEMPLGNIKFTNVHEDNAVYKIATTNLDALVIQDDDDSSSLKLNGLQIDALNLPPADQKVQSRPYEKLKIATSEYHNKNGKIAGANELEFAMSNSEQDDVISVENNINELYFFPNLLEDNDFSNIFKKLKYDEIHLSMHSKGFWKPNEGTLKLERTNLALRDGGTLNMTSEMAGLTRQTIEGFKSLFNDMKSEEAERDQTQLKAWKLAQLVKLKNFDIRYDDASLTNRILELAAEQWGKTRDSLVEEIKLFLPLISIYLKDPDFTQELTTQLNHFLKEPKSFQITAQPKTELPLSILLTAAKTDPKMAIGLLQLKVISNQ